MVFSSKTLCTMPFTPEQKEEYAQRAKTDGVRPAGDGTFGMLPKEVRALTDLSRTEIEWMTHMSDQGLQDRGYTTVLDACSGDGAASYLLYCELAKRIYPRRLLVLYAELQTELRDKLADLFRQNPRNYAALSIGWNFLNVHTKTMIPWQIHGAYIRYGLHWLTDAYEQFLTTVGTQMHRGGVMYIDTITPYNCLFIGDKNNQVVSESFQSVRTALKGNDFISHPSRWGGENRGGFTDKFFQRVLPSAGFDTKAINLYRNHVYRHNLGDKFAENIEVLARKR